MHGSRHNQPNLLAWASGAAGRAAPLAGRRRFMTNQAGCSGDSGVGCCSRAEGCAGTAAAVRAKIMTGQGKGWRGASGKGTAAQERQQEAGKRRLELLMCYCAVMLWHCMGGRHARLT